MLQLIFFTILISFIRYNIPLISKFHRVRREAELFKFIQILCLSVTSIIYSQPYAFPFSSYFVLL